MRLASGRPGFDSRFRLLSVQLLCFMDTLRLTIHGTLKWLSSLPILMQNQTGGESVACGTVSHQIPAILTVINVCQQIPAILTVISVCHLIPAILTVFSVCHQIPAILTVISVCHQIPAILTVITVCHLIPAILTVISVCQQIPAILLSMFVTTYQ